MNKRLRVVVTGATGFIARNFIKTYSDMFDIVGLSRRKLDDTNCNALFVQTSYDDDLKSILKSADAIVHLAAKKVSSRETQSMKLYFPDIELYENLIKASLDAGVKKIINISSRCVYGSSYVRNNERDLPNPINHYGIAKYTNELISGYYRSRGNILIDDLRLSQVYGNPHDNNSLINTFIKDALANRNLNLYGDPETFRDYIYIKDVVRAIYSFLSSDTSGVYNVASGEVITRQKLASTIIKVCNSESKIIIHNSDSFDPCVSLDTSKAFEHTGYKARYSFYEGISDYVHKVDKAHEK